MVFGRTGRGLMAPLLVANLVVHLIMLGLAGWSLDKYINGEQNHPHLGGNTSTSFVLIFALIAGVVGASSVLYDLIHLWIWRTDSLAGAAAAAIIALTIIALAFGLLCKEIILGGHRGKRLQTLEAMIAISLLSQLLYLVLLHAGMFKSKHGHGGPLEHRHDDCDLTSVHISSCKLNNTMSLLHLLRSAFVSVFF